MANRASIADLMGKVVLVHWELKRQQGTPVVPNYRFWEAKKAFSRPGWVVGERWLQSGTVVSDFGVGSVWQRRPDSSSTHCLLVVYWPTMKPVRVPLDGFEIAPETVRPYPPDTGPYTEDYRKRLREEMQGWPRDEKGRWVAISANVAGKKTR